LYNDSIPGSSSVRTGQAPAPRGPAASAAQVDTASAAQSAWSGGTTHRIKFGYVPVTLPDGSGLRQIVWVDCRA